MKTFLSLVAASVFVFGCAGKKTASDSACADDVAKMAGGKCECKECHAGKKCDGKCHQHGHDKKKK